MRQTGITLNIMEPRLMRKTDAAYYCARSANTFEAQCPVRPLAMPNGDKLWDRLDLDAWINQMKGDFVASDDEILGRLG